MNKKLLVVSILAVLMLVAISFSTAVSSNTTTDEKRESPLFRIRTRRAIGERLDDLKDIIKAKFVGDRVFFLPFMWLRNGDGLSVRQPLQGKTDEGSTNDCYTCHGLVSVCEPTCYQQWCTHIYCDTVNPPCL